MAETNGGGGQSHEIGQTAVDKALKVQGEFHNVVVRTPYMEYPLMLHRRHKKTDAPETKVVSNDKEKAAALKDGWSIAYPEAAPAPAQE